MVEDTNFYNFLNFQLLKYQSLGFPTLSNRNQHQTDSNSVLHLQILKNILLIFSSSEKKVSCHQVHQPYYTCLYLPCLYYSDFRVSNKLKYLVRRENFQNSIYVLTQVKLSKFQCSIGLHLFTFCLFGTSHCLTYGIQVKVNQNYTNLKGAISSNIRAQPLQRSPVMGSSEATRESPFTHGLGLMLSMVSPSQLWTPL